MGGGEAERVALMAIHPEFAEAILSGSKTVEFRKRKLAPDISKVFIYATAPTCSIVGWFTIQEIAEGAPLDIWRQFRGRGVIRYRPFRKYYAGCRSAVAIVIATAERLPMPLNLQDLSPRPPVPQSYVYLPEETLALSRF